MDFVCLVGILDKSGSVLDAGFVNGFAGRHSLLHAVEDTNP